MYKKIIKWGSMVCLCMFISGLQATNKNDDDYKGTASPAPVKQYADMLQQLSDGYDNEINETPNWSRQSSINNNEAQFIEDEEEQIQSLINPEKQEADDINKDIANHLKTINETLENINIKPLPKYEEEEQGWLGFAAEKGKKAISNGYVQTGLAMAIGAAWQATKSMVWKKVTDTTKPIYEKKFVDDTSKPIYEIPYSSDGNEITDTELVKSVDFNNREIEQSAWEAYYYQKYSQNETYEEHAIARGGQGEHLVSMMEEHNYKLPNQAKEAFKKTFKKGYEKKEVESLTGYEKKDEWDGIDYKKLLPNDIKLALTLLPAAWTLGNRYIRNPRKRRRIRKRIENVSIGTVVGAVLGPAAGAAAAAGAEFGDKMIVKAEESRSFQRAKEKAQTFRENIVKHAKKAPKKLTFDVAADEHLTNDDKKTAEEIKEQVMIYNNSPKETYAELVQADKILRVIREKATILKMAMDIPNPHPLPDLPTFTFDERLAMSAVKIGNTYAFKMACACTGVVMYYLALPYAAVFPRTSMLIIGTTASAYVGKVLTGSYLNGWVLGIVLLTITGLFYALFNRSLPKAMQQEEVKELVETIKDELKEAAAKAPIKPPKRFVPAPVQTKANGNKLPNSQRIPHPLLLIVLLGFLLGTFVFFVEKKRYKRRSKRRLARE